MAGEQDGLAGSVGAAPSAGVDMGGYTLFDDASLATRNTLRVAARAARLLELRDISSLPAALAYGLLPDRPLLVLGEGSNVLFADDFAGTVLVMATRGVHVESDAAGDHVEAAAGERWDDFVRWSLGQGYAGLENLIMIPGSVGAAPVQNIGAYGCEVAEFVEAVEVWDRIERRARTLDRADCAFGYRDSVFKHQPDRYIVSAVRFLLPRARPVRTDYAGIDEQLRRMGVDKPAPFHVAEAVVRLRTQKLPDPAVIGNAGSFFKNPVVEVAVVSRLKFKYPDLVAWPTGEGHSKLSAAWLIEYCGFKGLREGDAGVSNRHALVLVNHGQASGPQLWALAQRVMRGVHDEFGIELVPEPVIVGRPKGTEAQVAT